MRIPTDNEVIMYSNAYCFRGFDDLKRKGDVGAGRRWITRRMIVDENHGRSAEIQSSLDHFADIDRRVVDGSLSLLFVLE